MWKEVTHGIIGCAMQVHRTLGNGFQEVIYQRAMELEMAAKRIAAHAGPIYDG
jgi:GxxExxY protein